jgi:hypothetical protein
MTGSEARRRDEETEGVGHEKKNTTVVVFGLIFLVRGLGGCSLNFLKQNWFSAVYPQQHCRTLGGGGVSQRPSASARDGGLAHATAAASSRRLFRLLSGDRASPALIFKRALLLEASQRISPNRLARDVVVSRWSSGPAPAERRHRSVHGLCHGKARALATARRRLPIQNA